MKQVCINGFEVVVY